MLFADKITDFAHFCRKTSATGNFLRELFNFLRELYNFLRELYNFFSAVDVDGAGKKINTPAHFFNHGGEGIN